MDVELQILKHLRRESHPTVGVIDEYCQEYTDIQHFARLTGTVAAVRKIVLELLA